MVMQIDDKEVNQKMTKKRFGCLQVAGLIAIAVIISIVATILIIKSYFFPSEFKPVDLNYNEEEVLVKKLENLNLITGVDLSSHLTDAVPDKPMEIDRFGSSAKIEPEPYSEKGIKREITFTERELNGLLAKNTDLAKKLAIDLADDLISAKLILPVDEDFPVIGGKTVRLRSGMEFSYADGKPVVILKGITIMGVPVPNAWLGGIKNIDLVERFAVEKGFWKTFSDGVEDISVSEGLLKIKLRE